MYEHSKHGEQKIKQVTSVGLSLFIYQGDARSNKHKIVQQIKTRIWCEITFSEGHILSDIMWKNMVYPDGPQMKI